MRTDFDSYCIGWTLARAIATLRTAIGSILLLAIAACSDSSDNRIADGSGLRQFKQSFAPRAEPLYAAAPNLFLLCLAAPDILLRIRYPDGL